MDKTKTENRPTVGQLVNELQQKPIDVADGSLLEIAQDLLKDYESQFTQKIAEGKERYPKKDFFMEVHCLVPRLFNGRVFQFVMHPRRTFPVPTFDQYLYRYHHQSDTLELVWVIPSIQNCAIIYENRNNLPPELQDNLKYILHFKEGTLFRDMYKKYHKEFV